MTHFALALLLGGALQAAPQPAAPARPPQPPPQQQKRTASIEGMVTRAGTNEPLGRAQVTVTRVVAQAGQAPAAAAQAAGPAISPVLTEDDGKFVIKDLPAGSYRLTAAHTGYSRQEYGQRSLRNAGTPVTLQAGLDLKDIVFRLTPAGTISGRVTDATGEPVAGIIVQLLRPSYTTRGKQSLSSVTNARTNDLGEYRLYWINPGAYYLSAAPAGIYIQNFVGPTAQAGASSPQNNAADSTAVLQTVLGVNTNNVLQPDFAATYYPGTTDRLKALPITVRSGSEVKAKDISLAQERTFRVRGRILDSRVRQQPLRASVQMALKSTLGAAPPRNGSYDGSTGVFEFRDVAPGEYLIVAIAPSAVSPPALALETITVLDSLENLALTARPGISLSGKVALDDSKPLSTLPELARMRVALSPVSEETVNLGEPAPIKPDGTFTLDNVTPGTYRLNMVGMPANGYIKQGRFGAKNLLEEDASIAAANTESFEIVIGRNGGQVSGTLVDKDSKPVAAAQVVLAPDQQRDRRELLKARPTDQSGKFTFQGIPPGAYKLFAWDDIDPLAFTDPEILRQYESQAKAVNIVGPSKETVEVKIIPAAQ